MNQFQPTFIILRRTDTNEYLSHFASWDHDTMRWSANVDEAFLFRTHSDAEINGRMILDWLNDPLNRNVNLMCAEVGVQRRAMVVGEWFSVNVTRVA